MSIGNCVTHCLVQGGSRDFRISYIFSGFHIDIDMSNKRCESCKCDHTPGSFIRYDLEFRTCNKCHSRYIHRQYGVIKNKLIEYDNPIKNLLVMSARYTCESTDIDIEWLTKTLFFQNNRCTICHRKMKFRATTRLPYNAVIRSFLGNKQMFQESSDLVCIKCLGLYW